MTTDTSASKVKKKPTKIAPKKKATLKVLFDDFSELPRGIRPTKKLTKAQSGRLSELLSKSPPIEKLDPEIYAKLRSTINEVVEKTMPEYEKWAREEIIKNEAADYCMECDCDCTNCSSCGSCGSCICDDRFLFMETFIQGIVGGALSEALSTMTPEALAKAQLAKVAEGE